MNAVYLLARVCDECYAFAAEAVREVARALEVTAVPGAPPSVRGVHNLRGEIVPVVQLAMLLGLADSDAQSVVVAEHAGRRAALIVDELLDVAELPAELRAAEAPLAAKVLVDGDLVGVVDVAAILDELEAANPR